jgi:hypothetical protein
MATRLKWNGPAVRRHILTEMGRRLDAAMIVALNHWRTLLSIEGTAKAKGGRDRSGRFTKGKLRYGANPSKPGEPPRKQTGRLLGATAWVRENLVARIGGSVHYLVDLELGTHKMAARPSLRRAVLEKWHEMQAILSRPIP